MRPGTGITMAPEILAPAGDQDCFLAALAAGADAIYCGLRQFSARMEARNFTVPALARLTALAHNHGRRVYAAMNTLVKPSETTAAWRLAKALAWDVQVDGIIVQDLGMARLAREAGFEGMLAFSTLANVSNPEGLKSAKAFGADRVIIPRELSIDEMRAMGESCPPALGLECFVHGALCYCVSGRCYWSSYLGGKSGLRGRCVQPCRRVYNRASPSGKGDRFFSCQDLSLDVLVKTLLSIPNLVSWKIEGRKKSAHYVYHTVTAYRILADNPGDNRARDMALGILELALGRPGVHARFLPQRQRQPMAPGQPTGSGRLAGKIAISPQGKPNLKPRFELLPKDLLRIGVEDERWHATVPVKAHIPKGGNLTLTLPRHKTPKAGTPVFLIDRRETALEKLLTEWRQKLEAIPDREFPVITGAPKAPVPVKPRQLPDMLVRRPGKASGQNRKLLPGIWLSPAAGMPANATKTFFWLPPVIWPDNEESFSNAIDHLWKTGARKFVCNAPWQRAFFPKDLPKDASLIAGPFCNIANGHALEALARAGFCAAFASPELEAGAMLSLAATSPLPLGLVISGFFPVGISRFGLKGLTANEVFQSPLGETFWSRDYAGATWLFPGWPVNLESVRPELLKAGYSFFAILEETPPADLPKAKRPGLFNWQGELL